MKIARSLLSLTLSVSMVLSSVPTSAFATEVGVETEALEQEVEATEGQVPAATTEDQEATVQEPVEDTSDVAEQQPAEVVPSDTDEEVLSEETETQPEETSEPAEVEPAEDPEKKTEKDSEKKASEEETIVIQAEEVLKEADYVIYPTAADSLAFGPNASKLEAFAPKAAQQLHLTYVKTEDSTVEPESEAVVPEAEAVELEGESVEQEILESAADDQAAIADEAEPAAQAELEAQVEEDLEAEGEPGEPEATTLEMTGDGWFTLSSVSNGKNLEAKGSTVALAEATGADEQLWCAEAQGDGYVIINKGTGQVLDISGGKLTSGRSVGLYARNNSKAQIWSLYNMTEAYAELDARAAASVTDIPDGTYLLRPNHASFMVLDVSGASTANGRNVQLYKANMTAAQKWVISHDEKGYATITNQNSNKPLDVASGNPAPKTNVHQYAANGTRAQKWVIEKDGSTYKITSALLPNLVLEANAGGTSNGTNVQLGKDSGSNAQRFTLIDLNINVGPSDPMTLDGYYAIKSSIDTNYALDIAGGSTANGANVQLYKSNGTAAQTFSFKKVGDYYQIVSAVSDKVLDVDNGCPIPLTNVQQWPSATTNKNSLFSIRDNGDGTVSFINVSSGLMVDVSGGKASNGRNVLTYTANGTAAQKFVLSEVTSLVKPGFYEISPAYAGGSRLDVKGGGTANGTNVQIYSSNGSLAQKWEVSQVSGVKNTYLIKAVNAGKYLAATSGGNAELSSSNGANSQWVPFYSAGALGFKNVGTGKTLTVKGGSSANSTNVMTSAANGSNSQRFKLSGTRPIADGYYFISFLSGGSQVLDVAGGSKSNAANVRSYKLNSTGAQKWYLQRQSDGTYKIKNANSDKFLEVKGGSGSAGANIQQNASSNSKGQRWNIVYTGGAGTFKVVSALNSSLVLSAAGAATPSTGTNVTLESYGGATSQQFTFKATTWIPVPANQYPMYLKAQSFSSATSYLILVDYQGCNVGIYRGSYKNWAPVKYWRCSPGGWNTPTAHGVWTTGYKQYSFGEDHGYSCYYATYFAPGDYLFHSVKYYAGTRNIMDGRIGYHISAGCVRLAIENAKWIYDNIPYGTKVYVY